MKVLKQLYKLTLNFVTFILIVLAIISIISFISSAKQEKYISGIGNIKFLSVLSGSMAPTFNTYDMIIDMDTKASNIKIGDVITYWEENNLVTHRVKDIINKDGIIYFKTQGDANNVEDLAEVLAEDVVGRYIFKIPYLGLIMTKLKGPIGVDVVSIIALYISISETLHLILESRKKAYSTRDFKKDREYNGDLEKYE